MRLPCNLRIAAIVIGLSSTVLAQEPRVVVVPPSLPPGSGELDLSTSEMREAIERFTADQRTLNRSIPMSWSESRRQRLDTFYRDWLNAIDRLDFGAMGRDGRIDYVLLRNELNHELRQLDLETKKSIEVAPLLPYSSTIIDLEEARRRMDPIDPPRIGTRLTELAKQVDLARKQAEESLAKPKRGAKAEEPESGEAESPGRISRSVALRAAASAEDLKSHLGRWSTFYHGYDPLFTWWTTEPYKAVDLALKKHVITLREKVAGVKEEADSKEGREIIGDPVGREALLAELTHELIPYSPEELATIAEKELAWCEVEMIKASRDLGCGDDWKKALEIVKTRYVEPGKQPALIRELAQEAVDFLEKRDLVTIPPLAKESWRMEMMTPQRQLVNPFFTGGEVISVSFPTDGMTHEQKLMSMRGNNIHFSRATVHHELIPGHHLQGFVSSRQKTYRRTFSTPFSIEGWALYWELRLWDLGFPRSPEDRVGMLFWRSHRCARILFSMNFHLGKMTPQQCVDLLVDRIGHERANAEGEVRRSFEGSYPPLYQAAYLLGGLQLRALHGELVKTGKMTEKAFHDAVLKENQIPIALVRASLAGLEMDRSGSTAAWRFYGP